MQTLQQIWGPSAVLSGRELTINLNDFEGLDGDKPVAILYAVNKRVATTFPTTDTTSYNDPTNGVTASQLSGRDSLYSRNNVNQTGEDIGLTFYSPYNPNRDPDGLAG